MIRISKGPPGLLATTDRWGCPDGRWLPNCYGWVHEGLWERLQGYQAEVAPQVPGETMEDLRDRIKRQMDLAPHPYATWEFNAQAGGYRSPSDTIRFFAVFGEPQLVRWTWWDAHVRAPAFRWLARYLNSREQKRLQP